MKLQCQVEVINRTHSNLNLRTNNKFVKSTLALGKEPKCGTEFFILHFSTVNKSGTKYRIKHIKQVFVKCINDGKSTLRFEEPPHDLCIKSETIQLKCFMRLLKSCMSGDGKALQLTSLSSLAVTAQHAPTKLVIHDRSEFPNNGLPRTLQSLYLSGLKLCNFRRDILLLKHLRVLDLSNNEIQKLPKEFGRLPSLNELYLQNNQLGKGPLSGTIKRNPIDWSWLLEPQITKTLKLLDLSGNELDYLPRAIWKLQNLVTLKLDNNNLNGLPVGISRISRLRYLTLSKNKLQSLPCSLLSCCLEHIDISDNPLNEEVNEHVTITSKSCYTDKLIDLAGIAVLKHNIFYAPNIIPRWLVTYLDDKKICICGQPALNSLDTYCKNFDLKDYFKAVTHNRKSNVAFECSFCSSRCFNKYQVGLPKYYR